MEKTENSGNPIFALDIGTRSVVGVVGSVTDDLFSVFDHEQRFHKKRAMRDGQIEDINLVAKTVLEIKETLAERNGAKLDKVCIAAAGRSLKTVRSSYEQNISEEETITPELLHSVEYTAISAALDNFGRGDELISSYSCVGYDVVSYRLDDYLLSNPLGHRGSRIVVEIIAAFLPFSVIRSLYSVTELCGLKVESLTLEPIAAINAVVPPDIRLLNIAITDIGAGTSDIGISKNGSIVAYDMVTVAGDEITECIMKHYLVDFDTAESVKFKLSDEHGEITFSDILGISRSCSKEDIFGTINPVLENLCDSIAESILKINDGPPTALFLVGGGCQIPGLCRKMANKLGMSDERVTLGGKNPYKNIDLYTDSLLTPEYVTPLGIGATSRLTYVNDLFSVTVNGEKITMPGAEDIKILDALLLAGIKASNLMGRTPAPIIYSVNGEKRTARSSPPIPGEIYVNNELASLDTKIRQGDEIIVIFAQNGVPSGLTVSAICAAFNESISGVTVNGEKAGRDYIIQNNDAVEVCFGDPMPEATETPGSEAENESAGGGSAAGEDAGVPTPAPADPEIKTETGADVPAPDTGATTSVETKSTPGTGATSAVEQKITYGQSDTKPVPALNPTPAPATNAIPNIESKPVPTAAVNPTVRSEITSNTGATPAVDSKLTPDADKPRLNESANLNIAEAPKPRETENVKPAVNPAPAPEITQTKEPEPAGANPAAKTQTAPFANMNPVIEPKVAAATNSTQTADPAPAPAASTFSDENYDYDDDEDDDIIIENTDTFQYIELPGAPPPAGFAEKAPPRSMRVYVNDNPVDIPVEEGDEPLFLDMLNFVDIDTKNAKGDLVLLINNAPASYTDPVFDGDRIYIRWDE